METFKHLLMATNMLMHIYVLSYANLQKMEVPLNLTIKFPIKFFVIILTNMSHQEVVKNKAEMFSHRSKPS